jgi:DinB family protein
MAIPQRTRDRLAIQLDVLNVFLEGASAVYAEIGPEDGGWSAKENVAHLARHAHVFLGRVDRILREDRPNLGTYRPEEDPEWPVWRALPLDEALRRLRAARAQLLAWIDALSEREAGRVGVHPQFGAWDIQRWLEFFLLHEAHHLYFMVRRLAQAKQNRS